MKILMIGAHQDDNEFRSGGLAYKYVQMGHDVRFLSLCNGCKGHHILTPEETSKVRKEESMQVSKLLGVKYDVWDDVDDCTLTASLENRYRLIRYIRNYNPDMIVCHRPNDYHADHRAAGQLIQDASYMLVVPHDCPDTPAMTKMPVIFYSEDGFKNPDFSGDFVVDISDVIDVKLQIAHLNKSQVYEWLPFVEDWGEVPESDEDRYEWMKGMNITEKTTDKEVMSTNKKGYMIRFAKTAARFRKELIKTYGKKIGKKVRFAEAYELCEYGSKPDEKFIMELMSL